jgi:hypothetical protein
MTTIYLSRIDKESRRNPDARITFGLYLGPPDANSCRQVERVGRDPYDFVLSRFNPDFDLVDIWQTTLCSIIRESRDYFGVYSWTLLSGVDLPLHKGLPLWPEGLEGCRDLRASRLSKRPCLKVVDPISYTDLRSVVRCLLGVSTL